MGKWQGKVRYPFILFAQSQEDVPDWLFRHEMEHVYQVYRMGCIWFYIKYLLLAIRYGHQNHPYEIEARARQNDPLSVKERALKNRGFYG